MKKFIIYLNVIAITFQISIGVGLANEYKHWKSSQNITFYVQPYHQNTKLVKYAVNEWTKATKGKISFTQVYKKENANITVQFVDKLNNNQIGITHAMYDSDTDELASAEITIASKHPKGKVLSEDIIYTAMVHEVGHALGYHRHSNNPDSIMYPSADVKRQIIKDDLDIFRKIYKW